MKRCFDYGNNMILSQMYKKKPNTYFAQNIEEYASKRDNVLYSDKDISILSIEEKIGFLISFENIIEKRVIEKGIVSIYDYNSISKNNPKTNYSNEVIILNPWECELYNSDVNFKSKSSQQNNTYILFEEDNLCYSCNGTGKQVCNHCEGRGKLPAEQSEDVVCSECEGEGIFTCDICKGNGKIKTIHTLNQVIQREFTEKTLIVDELGSVEVLHNRVNTDLDFMVKLSYSDIKKGKLRDSFYEFNIPENIINNLLISIEPYLESFEKDTKKIIDNINIYSFPINFVNCKVRDKKPEFFIFVGKDYILTDKQELVTHSNESEKEFTLLTANLESSKNKVRVPDKKDKKVNKTLYILSIVGTFLITAVILIIIFSVYFFPKLNKNNIDKQEKIVPDSSIIKMEAPLECEFILNTSGNENQISKKINQEKLDAVLALAEIYVKNDSINYAISIYNFLADCYIKSNMNKENLHIYNRIAELYLKLKDEKKAVSFYEKALEIARVNNAVPEQAFLLSVIADIESNMRNYKSAGTKYKYSSELYKRIGNTEKEIEMALNASEAYIQIEKITEAYSILEYVLKYAKENEDEKILTEALLSLAEIEIKRGFETKDTEKYLQQAQNLATEKNDIAKLNLVMGKYYYKRNKIKDASTYSKIEEYYKKAGTIYLELENFDMVASTLNSLGIIYIEMENFDDAEEKLLKALEIRRLLNSKADEASVMFNLAHLYEKKLNFSKAIDYMEQVIRIDKELGLEYLENDKTYLDRLKQYKSNLSETGRKSSEEIINEGRDNEDISNERDKTIDEKRTVTDTAEKDTDRASINTSGDKKRVDAVDRKTTIKNEN